MTITINANITLTASATTCKAVQAQLDEFKLDMFLLEIERSANPSTEDLDFYYNVMKERKRSLWE